MKWLRRLILLLLALFIIWALAVNTPLNNFEMKPTQSTPGSLQNVQRNLENNLRLQRQQENLVRRHLWRIENPTLPDTYNPYNYYVP